MRTVTVTHDQDCWRFRIPRAKDWKDLADHLSPRLKPGDVIAISGPLGAGKTTFVQALAKSLGVKKIPQSPTFALMRSYKISPPLRVRGGRGSYSPVKRLLHVDAYRIEHPRELLALDLDEECSDGKTIVVIEWPEKIRHWLSARSAISIAIAVTG